MKKELSERKRERTRLVPFERHLSLSEQLLDWALASALFVLGVKANLGYFLLSLFCWIIYLVKKLQVGLQFVLYIFYLSLCHPLVNFYLFHSLETDSLFFILL